MKTNWLQVGTSDATIIATLILVQVQKQNEPAYRADVVCGLKYLKIFHKQKH